MSRIWAKYVPNMCQIWAEYEANISQNIREFLSQTENWFHHEKREYLWFLGHNALFTFTFDKGFFLLLFGLLIFSWGCFLKINMISGMLSILIYFWLFFNSLMWFQECYQWYPWKNRAIVKSWNRIGSTGWWSRGILWKWKTRKGKWYSIHSIL